MGEDSFFDALSHIMWEMEIDIFLEQEKTLALAADFAPKCKKQLNRLKAMYECGAMEKIDNAIKDKSSYAENMWQAVDLICDALNIEESKAVFAVNKIIGLWEGDLPELDDTENNKKGDENMLFLQDVTDNTTENENAEAQQPEEEKVDDQQEPAKEENEHKPAIISRIVHFWCFNDCEQGRPYMVACPIGWIIILLCTVFGIFMVYDIPLGDKLVPPVFIFMYSVLAGKRLYRFESAGRLSIAVALFYTAACLRSLWIGGIVPIRCIWIVFAALMVFNNGRFSALLDSEKRKPWLAYLLITIFSAAITASIYAIQNVQF